MRPPRPPRPGRGRPLIGPLQPCAVDVGRAATHLRIGAAAAAVAKGPVVALTAANQGGRLVRRIV
jgi:hypothetical protein